MKTFLNKVNYLMLVVAGSLLLNASYIAAAPRVNPNIPPIIKGNGCNPTTDTDCIPECSPDCDVEPTPCPLGSNVRLDELDFTSVDPPRGTGWPCDVFPAPGDNSTLLCDDTCGCIILQANCTGTWSCNPNECECSP